MNFKDIFWLSYTDLAQRKVRTALTIIMVVIGVASIVALISITQGVGASISQELGSLGPTSIIVTSVRAEGFTAADVAAISTLPNVSQIIPILTGGTVTLLAGGQNESASLIGVSSEGLEALIGNTSLYQGSLYQDTVAPTAVLGYSLAFPTTTAGRQAITVGQPATLVIGGKGGERITVPVVGVLQSSGASLISTDSAVVMSLPAAEALLHKASFNEILVKATNTSSVAPLAALITDIYGNGARVITTQELIQTTSQIIGSITLLLVIVAGISLLVAAIGIMNIMLISVYERIHDIGIMKSVGFRNSHIMLVFLVQALIIGIIGGVVGIVTGTAASYSLAFLSSGASSPSQPTTATPAAPTSTRTGSGAAAAGGGATFAVGSGGSSSGSSSSSISLQPSLTISTVVLALSVAIIVSVVAGTYPAWRASKLEPIEALRQL